MTTAADLVIPYITARAGEEADLLSHLCVRQGPDRQQRLAYVDEDPRDRDHKGVLWARYSMSLDAFGNPAGRPQWRLVHPLRQRVTMHLLRCQVCAEPVPRRGGVLFLETASRIEGPGPLRTAQPPVCREHARMAAERCPHLRRHGYIALRATRYPLYGVIGTRYRYGENGLQALVGTEDALPHNHPQIGWFLVSQLVRELREYDIVHLDDLAP
ncbi:hypothetical protein [Streptomyces thermoalcalitolerans]|uniref:Uncharacterized protein n=1 Tax=Streptomyces thermoalcalitolerans TaxID=65605 RepID=A0ABN1NGR7_9ACTN